MSSPIDDLAAITLLEQAITKLRDGLKEKAHEYAKSVRSRSFDTDFGTAGVTKGTVTTHIDEAKLLEWAYGGRPDMIRVRINPGTMARAIRVLAEHAPDALEEYVDPTFVAHQKAAKYDRDNEGNLITPDGEVATWAHRTTGKDTMTVRNTPEAKAAAVEHLSARLSDVLAASTPKEIDHGLHQ